jgi:hypothetical protein
MDLATNLPKQDSVNQVFPVHPAHGPGFFSRPLATRR